MPAENGGRELTKNFYRVDEAAEILDCSRPQVYVLFNRGDLKGVRFGKRKGIRILRSSLEHFINEGGNGKNA